MAMSNAHWESESKWAKTFFWTRTTNFCFLCKSEKEKLCLKYFSKINFCLIEFWAGLTVSPPQIPPFLVRSHLSLNLPLIWRRQRIVCEVIVSTSGPPSMSHIGAVLIPIASRIVGGCQHLNWKLFQTDIGDLYLAIQSYSNERARQSWKKLIADSGERIDWQISKSGPQNTPQNSRKKFQQIHMIEMGEILLTIHQNCTPAFILRLSRLERNEGPFVYSKFSL